ncbi:MAG: phosphotransferase [Rhodospirillales bacterium]|nr:phosphotransferase [Rhodospirillales bacterium]
MTDRSALIESFLTDSGWDGAQRQRLAGDASNRRYERLTLGNRKAMLMDAPPPLEDVDAFVAVARHLKRLGFSAPDIFAKGKGDGFLLIEDLGDDTFTQVLGQDIEAEAGLYELAVDVLIALHGIAADRVAPPGLEAYDDDKLLEEALLLPDWTWAGVANQPLSDDIRDAYQAAWRDVFPIVHRQPPTMVLRDYHVDNLMVLSGRDGVARCGLLDFQDAVLGPQAYDLMSLLEDARRDITDDLRNAMLERYYAGFPDIDRQEFETVFAILAAQRHAKVIGIFTRLCVRDDKAQYLDHIPRVWRLLEAALKHSSLAPVAAWFEAHMPPEKRGVPPCEGTQ